MFRHMCKQIDIDDPNLTDAMDSMVPGDHLIVEGKGGPMSVIAMPHKTPLEIIMETPLEEFGTPKRPIGSGDSWLD